MPIQNLYNQFASINTLQHGTEPFHCTLCRSKKNFIPKRSVLEKKTNGEKIKCIVELRLTKNVTEMSNFDEGWHF